MKGRYRVTLYAKEGTYALSVPKSRLGHLLLPVARAHPFEIRLKSPVSVDVPRGVKPIGKAARKTFTYTPLRPRKLRPRRKKAAAPAPKIEEVTSGLAIPAETAPKKRSRKKAVAATAA